MTANHPHRDSGVLGEIAGRPVLLHFGDVPSEYSALSTGALLVDRSYRSRAEVTGPKAAEAVNGLVTNDVVSLQPGTGAYAGILSPKGKVLADVRIFRYPDRLMLDAPPRSAAALPSTLKKFINPRTAPHRDLSATLMDLGVFGSRAAAVVSQVLDADANALMALPMYGHVDADFNGASITIARVPDVSVPGFDLFVPTEHMASLSDRLLDAGAVPGGLAAFEIARVEAGRPEWGIDMDDNTIPQEANFDELGAISYTKGCYTGQETVARVHFRGHVNRTLRGVRASGTTPPAYLAALFDGSGKAVGEVHSTASSPRLGGIALAMVRREVENGTQLIARWNADLAGDIAAGETQVDVVPLPFPS